MPSLARLTSSSNAAMRVPGLVARVITAATLAAGTATIGTAADVVTTSPADGSVEIFCGAVG